MRDLRECGVERERDREREREREREKGSYKHNTGGGGGGGGGGKWVNACKYKLSVRENRKGVV